MPGPGTIATAPSVARATSSGRSAAAWVWPTRSTAISQGVSASHMAIDIPGSPGAPVVAPTRGTVTDIKYQPEGYGLNVRLQTESGLTIILAHLQAAVKDLFVGQQVEAGQVVGLLGSTGHSTGPHLHLEVRQPGYAVDRFIPNTSSGIGAIDPMQFLSGTTSVAASRTTPSTSTYTYAPTTRTTVATSTTPAGTPIISAPKVSAKSSAASAAKAGPTSVGVSSVTGTAGTRAGQAIKIASTPIGDVTVPAPGELFTSGLIIAIGVILVIAGMVMLGLRAAKGTTRGIEKGADLAGEVKKAVSA